MIIRTFYLCCGDDDNDDDVDVVLMLMRVFIILTTVCVLFGVISSQRVYSLLFLSYGAFIDGRYSQLVILQGAGQVKIAGEPTLSSLCDVYYTCCAYCFFMLCIDINCMCLLDAVNTFG